MHELFYIASKLFYVLFRPSAIAFVLVFFGTCLVISAWRAKLGQVSLVAGALMYVVCGLAPLGNFLMIPLENRFPQPAPPAHVAGIIILGGYEDSVLTELRGSLTVNERAERLLEGLRLARLYPTAKVVVTGGSAPLFGGAPRDAAGPVGRYLREVGIAPERIVIEDRSLTTHENALYSRALIDPHPDEPYLLVTSAVHMPRSMGIFRHQGYNVIAWPVDFRTEGPGNPWSWNDNFPEGLDQVDYAFKEWVGLLAYWLVGRTDALFPGPKDRSIPTAVATD